MIRSLYLVFIGVIIYAASHFAAFPYSILDWSHFKQTTVYESGLGFGKQIVFYTQQFVDTKPFVFQLIHIYPFTLGNAILITGFVGIIVLAINILKILMKSKNKNRKHLLSLLTVVASFLAIFSFNSILFVKWTRFLSPTFPFYAIFTVYFLANIKNNQLVNLLTVIIAGYSILWSTAFMSIYLNKDVRITANSWIGNNISSDQNILTESRNMIEVPFDRTKRTTFEIYDIESDPNLKLQFIEEIERADYFIIQSRRLYANFHEPKYPTIGSFYRSLFDGSLGFEEVKQFSSYPSINFGFVALEFPDEYAEETLTVFDHPVIRIYKKVKHLSQNEYYQILVN